MLGGYDGNWLFPGHILIGRHPEAHHLPFFQELGLRSVLNLRESVSPEEQELYTTLGLTAHHLPVTDHGVPPFDDLLAGLKFMREAPRPLLVHCFAGIGRAGLFGVTYAALTPEWSEIPASQVVDHYRRNVRYCLDSREQIDFIQRAVVELRAMGESLFKLGG